MKPLTLIPALAALCVLLGLVVGALRVGPRRPVAILWWLSPLILGLGIPGVTLSLAPDLASVWTVIFATPIGWLFVTGLLSGILVCTLTFAGDAGRLRNRALLLGGILLLGDVVVAALSSHWSALGDLVVAALSSHWSADRLHHLSLLDAATVLHGLALLSTWHYARAITP